MLSEFFNSVGRRDRKSDITFTSLTPSFLRAKYNLYIILCTFRLTFCVTSRKGGDIYSRVNREEAEVAKSHDRSRELAFKLHSVPALSYMINRATSGSLATKIISGAIYAGWDKDESLRRERRGYRARDPALLYALVTIPRMEIDGIPGRTIGKPELFRAVGASILANLDRNDVNEVHHRTGENLLC